MLLMKLKSFNYSISLLIILFCSPLLCDDKIDIWNNKNGNSTAKPELKKSETQKKPNLDSTQTIEAVEKIQIQDSTDIETNEEKIFGIYDPANYDFNLNMWTTTKAEDVRSSLKRLQKIELSKSSSEILETILSLLS